jgi:hypothetical protein
MCGQELSANQRQKKQVHGEWSQLKHRQDKDIDKLFNYLQNTFAE